MDVDRITSPAIALEETNTLLETIDSRDGSSSTTSLLSSTLTSTNVANDPALAQLHSSSTGLFSPTSTTLMAGHSLTPSCSLPISTQIKLPACGFCTTFPLLPFFLARHCLHNLPLEHHQYHQYQDPVTTFLKELYVEFDFGAAQKALKEAVDVVENDSFLGEFKDDFLDNIDISDLSERIHLTRDEGEKWIVNLIRETRMGADAKIDLEKNVIEINRPPQLVYQSVIGKTRGLALRTQAIRVAVARAGAVPLEKQMQTREHQEPQQDLQSNQQQSTATVAAAA
ncbi:hypothetical protein M378DRAFT_12729 [Amanita muscaria Koide BX008]|uniref:PCI domain-containing protein n=1 Tax=Amanita muscaria (strain Koide BX008) TaxID=946122 RepID=A0A0C2X0L2_AMAMK|nr:hypothetical protein M378DRAFT_12729 [Amanita muscaria Koide BX008]